MCSKERKKQLSIDLTIIAVTALIVLVLVMGVWGSGLNRFAHDQTRNIVFRVAVIGICCQFGLAGLGITIVCLIRKEKFTQFGLTTKKIVPAVLLSLACSNCVIFSPINLKPVRVEKTVRPFFSAMSAPS